jgi:hypothetical protein
MSDPGGPLPMPPPPSTQGPMPPVSDPGKPLSPESTRGLGLALAITAAALTGVTVLCCVAVYAAFVIRDGWN